MGAVHGVYLKYVGLSVLSFAGYSWLMSGGVSGDMESLSSSGSRSLLAPTTSGESPAMTLWQLIPAAILAYSSVLNGVIAILFKLEWGMGMIGKDPKTGRIPMWSYMLYFPFHLPSILYTYVHTRHGTAKVKLASGEIKKDIVPLATEVQPGWWVGGCYSHELNKDWAGVVDHTVEFPEGCINRTQSYLLLPTWDGVPASPEQLEKAALFAVEASKNGDVLVHCAHGRGRSTTVMCACLVKAGLYPTWQDAFEKGIKPSRPVCKLNGLMQKVLTTWQAKYVDGKKNE